MHFKIPILSAIVVLTTVLAIPLATHTVGAIPGNGVDSPLNVWTPYGPNTGAVNKIQYQYYATETSEFQEFELGHIDLTDWELPPAKYASYDANPDFLLTPNQGQFGDYGFYFNGLSSRFTKSPDNGIGPLWGCDWNTGTVGTTSYQSYVTTCGINMRQGFAHLIDRPTFSNNFGGLAGIACDSPPAKSPTCVTVAQQCAWDTLSSTCIDAFRIAPSPSGFAAPGSADFCSAADHMIAAGIATGKQSGTCVLTGVNAGVSANPFRAMIRNNDPRRLAMGNGLMNAINQLFGGNVVTPTYGNIRQIGFPIVFSAPPDGPLDDWDGYTFGYLLGSPYPDHLYGLFNSIFASNYCGTGVASGEPDNPTFVCTTGIDTATRAAAQTSDVPAFTAATLAAFDALGKATVDIPVFTPAIRIPALRSVDGLVNVKGIAYNSAQDILFAHKGTYTPSNPLYRFGGSGDPSTLRYGQASGTQQLNIFNAQTVWEFQALGEIYDTLFTASPINPGNIFCNMCDFYTKVVDGAGNTHFRVQLRQNLFWQDGVQVDAFDVKFTWLNFRDNPTTVGGNLPGLLLNINVVDSRTLDVVWAGQSISFPVYMETFVLPRHLWELAGDLTYGDVGAVDPTKITNSYDPLTSGTLVGSGPFACLSVFGSDIGKVGTGCGKNADGSRAGQSLGIGATLLLQAYDFVGQAGTTNPLLQYMRSYDANWGTGSGTAAHSGQFQEFRWTDNNKDAQITVSDLAGVASCSGATVTLPTDPCFYWLQTSFHPGSNTINQEVQVVLTHLDDTFVSPFSWSTTSLSNIITYP